MPMLQRAEPFTGGDPMWTEFNPPGPLSQQLWVDVELLDFPHGGSEESLDLVSGVALNGASPDPADYQGVVNDALWSALGQAIEPAIVAWGADLTSFLPGYVFAINDVFGLPGVLQPTWDSNFQNFAPPAWWQDEAVSSPTIQAVLPVQADLGRVSTLCAEDSETPPAWRENLGATFVLGVSNDSAPIPAHIPGLHADDTTLGLFTVEEIAPEDMIGGSPIAAVAASLLDVNLPGHALSNQILSQEGASPADRFTDLLVSLIENHIDIGVPNQTSRCDVRYGDAGFGGLGADAAAWVAECVALQVVDFVGVALFVPGSSAGDGPPACSAQCALEEQHLRDAWSSVCRDTNVAVEPRFDSAVLGGIAPGWTCSGSYDIGVASDPSDDVWTPGEDSDGDLLWNEDEYEVPSWWGSDPVGICWALGGASLIPPETPDRTAPLEAWVMLLALDPSGLWYATSTISGADVDVDLDGFPNHLDPDSSGAGRFLDGPIGFGDDHLRFSSVFSLPGGPAPLLPAALVPGLLGLPDHIPVSDCVRLNIEAVTLRAPGTDFDQQGSLPVVENGPASRPPVLTLARGGSYGLDRWVPAIRIEDDVIVHAKLDIDGTADFAVGIGPWTNPALTEHTCDGSLGDVPFDGNMDLELPIHDLDFQLPFTLRWDIPLAVDRDWGYVGAWQDANEFPPTLGQSVNATNSSTAGYDEIQSMEQATIDALVAVEANLRPTGETHFSLIPGPLSLTPRAWGPQRDCVVPEEAAAIADWENPPDAPGCPGADLEFSCSDGFGGGDADSLVDCADPDCFGNPDCWIDLTTLPGYPGLAPELVRLLLGDAIQGGSSVFGAVEDQVNAVLGVALSDRLNLWAPHFQGQLWNELERSDTGFMNVVDNLNDEAGTTANLSDDNIFLPGLLHFSSTGGSNFGGLAAVDPELRVRLLGALGASSLYSDQPGIVVPSLTRPWATLERLLFGLLPSTKLPGVHAAVGSSLVSHVGAHPREDLFAGWQITGVEPEVVPWGFQDADQWNPDLEEFHCTWDNSLGVWTDCTWDGRAQMGFYEFLVEPNQSWFPPMDEIDDGDPNTVTDRHPPWKWREIEVPPVSPGALGAGLPAGP